MAEFIVGTGTSVTPLLHSNNIFKNYLKQISFKGLFGKPGSHAPIIVDNTLKGKAGETLRYHFIPQDDGDWILGQNATILGNEDSLSEYTMDITIDQLAKAFRKKGKMTDKRIIWNAREEISSQLTEWFAQVSEDLIVYALTGYVSGAPSTTRAALRAKVASSTDTTDTVTGAGRIIQAVGSTGSSEVTAANSDSAALYTGGADAMTAADKISPRLIEDAVVMAKTSGTYKIRPIRVGPNGEEHYVLYVHTRVARDLRAHPDWMARAISVRDKGLENDPIATGALGVVNNVIIKESERICRFGTGSLYFARNLLLGADAMVLAWAQTTDYVEDNTIDMKRIFVGSADEIRAQKKLTFNSVDVGVCQVVTAAN